MAMKLDEDTESGISRIRPIANDLATKTDLPIPSSMMEVFAAKIKQRNQRTDQS